MSTTPPINMENLESLRYPYGYGTDKQQYVVGFLFSSDLTEVLLMFKSHPEWQAGCLNGVGGHVLPNETVWQAMYREFEEETFAHVYNFERYAVIEGHDWVVHCFTARHYERTLGVFKDNVERDEPLCRAKVSELRKRPKIVHNVTWLVQQARGYLKAEWRGLLHTHHIPLNQNVQEGLNLAPI